MKIKNYLNIVTTTTIIIGFCAFSLMEEHSTTYLIMAASLSLLSIFIATTKKLSISKLIWNITALIIIVMFFADYFILGSSFLGSISKMISILIILKILDLHSTKDYWTLYTLVLFEILASSASTVSIAFLLILIAFIINTIWAMVIFNLNNDIEESQLPVNNTLPKRFFGLTFAFSTIVMTFLSTAITIAIFLIMPRVGVGIFDIKTMDTVKVSGFSDSINLGAIGQVKLDNTVVMRVSFDKDKLPKKTLYFKGLTHDYYTGSGWNRTKSSKFTAPKKSSPINKANNIFTIEDTFINTTKQIIQLEPLATDVLFALGQAVIIEGDFHKILYTESGTVHMPAAPFARKKYTVISKNSDHEIGFNRNGLSPTTLQKYLNVENVSPEIKKLSLNITKKLGLYQDYEKIIAIESYLQKNFEYTLNPPVGSIKEPIANFLLDTKKGYCEHYASSMVAMLRFNDIPSRIVTGFSGGSWNRYGKYLTIRNKDAHSWIEAYIYGKGWMRFDPTPTVPFGSSVKIYQINDMMDSLVYRWNRYVINYSITEQIQSAMKLHIKSIELKNRFNKLKLESSNKERQTAVINFFKRNLFTILIIMVTVTLLLYSIYLIASLKNTSNNKNKTPEYYLKMLGTLKSMGFLKRDSETSHEFAAKISKNEVDIVTKYYEKNKFGKFVLSKEEMLIINNAIAKLKN